MSATESIFTISPDAHAEVLLGVHGGNKLAAWKTALANRISDRPRADYWEKVAAAITYMEPIVMPPGVAGKVIQLFDELEARAAATGDGDLHAVLEATLRDPWLTAWILHVRNLEARAAKLRRQPS